jgi:hypothetical protein
VEKTAKKFRSFADAEKADRDFYKRLTGNERLRIVVQLLNKRAASRPQDLADVDMLEN